MRNRSTRLIPAFLLIMALLALASCPGTDPYDALYGVWEVDSIENPLSTDTSSHPWIKLSSSRLVTFVHYTPALPPDEWRECTLRSGTVTGINADSITITEDYDGATLVIGYTFDGTTFSITWSDGEVYLMSTAAALPYPEAEAVSSACFN